MFLWVSENVQRVYGVEWDRGRQLIPEKGCILFRICARVRYISRLKRTLFLLPLFQPLR